MKCSECPHNFQPRIFPGYIVREKGSKLWITVVRFEESTLMIWAASEMGNPYPALSARKIEVIRNNEGVYIWSANFNINSNKAQNEKKQVSRKANLPKSKKR